MNPRIITVSISALALLLTACQTAPKAAQSGIVASSFPLASPTFDVTSAAALDWRDVLIDPRLQALVQIALSDSRDLRIAVLDAEAARAQLRVQRAVFWPQIEAQAQATKNRDAGQSAGRIGGSEEGQQARTLGQTQIGLNLTAFEIDLFGRLRAESESASAAYLAAGAGRDAARIALISTVADAYIAQRAAQENLSLTEATLDDWRRSLAMAEQLKAAGRGSALDVAQALGQVRTAEADLAAAQRTLSTSTNALTLAIGRPIPADLPAGLPLDAAPVVTILPVGLPSDLLEARPDIRQAEHRLSGANADIEAARAAFFPRLTLTGALGFGHPELHQLLKSTSGVWSYTPQITLPIFQGGRLKGSLDLARIRGDSAVANYERSIQVAFREVADGLAQRETYERQVASQSAAVEAAERRLSLSDQRFRAGVDSRLELLDAQRQLYAARQSLVTLRQSRYASAIVLFRALGGGLREAAINDQS